MRLVEALQKEAYRNGWNDAVASIVAAASKEPGAARPTPATTKRNVRPKGGMPAIGVIFGIIKEKPGLRGIDIFKEAVRRIHGADLKTMDRTGRTALSRLRKRGMIRTREKKWYPVEEVGRN